MPNTYANTEKHPQEIKKIILIYDNTHNIENITTNNDTKKNNKNKNYNQPKRYRNGLNLQPVGLNISGSSQPNVADLQYIIQEAKQHTANHSTKEIFILDLREEPHAMLNERAVSWYGFKNQVKHQLEPQLIAQLSAKKKVKIYQGLTKLPGGFFIPKSYSTIEIHKVTTEQLATEELGANYQRILVIDHFAPKPSEVDLFVKFVKNLPKNSWIHVHCRGGRGRTTTFMSMYDIIQNAHSLALDSILERQHQLGGVKLSKVKFLPDRKKWKEPAAKDRYSFIQKFYNYVLDPNGYSKVDWSEWSKNSLHNP